MYTGNKLIELLEKQHQSRHPELFKKGNLSVLWRAKVGSFPHPDIETIVSAGEPCGAWKPTPGCPQNLSRPEGKRNVGENLQFFQDLPLNGYIPGSAIRGLVRSWAKQRPEIAPRMRELLGYQDDTKITAGKIEFLDAWPEKATKLTLDIVNPQQEFQVYHQGQGKPLSFYTLGNGEQPISVTVAIRGIPNKATAEEVNEVWEWVKQALSLYGVGSRTASGYGAINAGVSQPNPEPEYAVKSFDFTLYSQGCYGANPQEIDLRPAHWRGWLRSWLLRFLLGVMSEANAKQTLAELLGTLEPKGVKGCVRLQMTKGDPWGKSSKNSPRFYSWKGKLQISAPKEIQNKIILPVIRFAVMVGGVGRGWRRPLHIFNNDSGYSAARGAYLRLTHQVKNATTNKFEPKPFGLALNPEKWNEAYQNWLTAVRSKWPNRINIGINNQQAWEIFSPTTCAVYAVAGPNNEPVDFGEIEWQENGVDTRGDGMDLIYDPNYKRKIDVGGNAAGGDSHCSWVSIKRVKIRHQTVDTDCQEVVCLFMGGKTAQSNHLRSRFLRDLAGYQGALSLFGVTPAP